MSASEARALHPSALSDLMNLMQQVLAERGSVTFVVTENLPPGEFGCTYFNTGEAHFAANLSDRDFIEVWAHELVHLMRGPAYVDQADAEEVDVERIAQELLYGSAPAPVARPMLRLVHGGAR